MNPALYCPFASRINAEAASLETQNLAWLFRRRLITSADTAVRLSRAKFGQLAARAYPDASIDLLGIAAAWSTWLFLRDEQCDGGGLSADPMALRILADQQIDVLAGQRPHRDDGPLTLALVDLRERMLARGGGRWMSRFLVSVQDYFDASVWKAENRVAGRVPDLDTFVRLRALTGAVKTCFDILELSESPLPIEARYDTRLAEMMQLANRAICWSNDIFSVRKELAEGDVHNLVIVLQHTTGSSVPEAMLEAARMHDAAVRGFEHHEQALRASESSLQVRRFVDALKGWVRANLDWSIETGRYAPLAVV